MVAEKLRFLRTRAKQRFLERLAEAAQKYFARTKSVPARLDEFASVLTPPVDPAIFSRYDFQNEKDHMLLAEKFAGAADPDRLALFVWGDSGTKQGFTRFISIENAQGRSVREAAEAFARVHSGARVNDPAQLAPFLSAPLDAETLVKAFQQLPPTHRSAGATVATP